MSPAKGVIVAWKPEKGFGFIRPEGGGIDVFVHVRDFGNISRPPSIGDKVTYQPMKGEDGRLRAADVQIAGLPRIRTARAISRAPKASDHRKSTNSQSIGVVLVIMVAGVIYWNSTRTPPAAREQQIVQSELESQTEDYQCEGKRYCSEMNSCGEATYYLKHCPGTEMDGDGDGRPCEDQCGH